MPESVSMVWVIQRTKDVRPNQVRAVMPNVINVMAAEISRSFVLVGGSPSEPAANISEKRAKMSKGTKPMKKKERTRNGVSRGGRRTKREADRAVAVSCFRSAGASGAVSVVSVFSLSVTPKWMDCTCLSVL